MHTLVLLVAAGRCSEVFVAAAAAAGSAADLAAALVAASASYHCTWADIAPAAALGVLVDVADPSRSSAPSA